MGLLQQQGFTSIGGQDEEKKKSSRGLLQQRGYTSLQQTTRIEPKVEITTQKKITPTQEKQVEQPIKTITNPQTEGFNLNSFLGNITESIKKAVVSAIPQLNPDNKPTIPTAVSTPSQLITPTQPLKTLEPIQNKGLDSFQLKSKNIIDSYLKTSLPSAQLTQPAKEIAFKKARTKTTEEVRRELPKSYKEPGTFGGAVEELKQSLTSTAGGLGASLEMVGNMTNMMAFSEAGKKIKQESDNLIASNPEWAAPKDQKWGVDKVARLAVGAAPSLLAMTAATLLAGPVGGAAVGFGLEAGSTYKEAKEAGVPESQAQIYGTLVGIVNGMLETIFPSSLKGVTAPVKDSVKKVGKELVIDILKKVGKFGVTIAKDGALEGTTESLQELWSNIIATNYDKNRKPWDNLLESFVGGFIPGATIGGVSHSFNVLTPQQAKIQVEGTDLKGTLAGEAITKVTQQAESEGNNIKIEIVENKEGAITTPGGTNIKVSVVEDKAPIQQFTGEELKKMNPEEKQKIVDERQKQSFIKTDTEQPKVLRIGGQYATLTPEQSVALRNEVQIIPQGTKEQLHLNLESKAIGANETKVDLAKLAEQYPDVKKALDNAGIKIEQIDTLTQEADKTLLTSEQAKQIETQATEYTKQVREKISKLEEDVTQIRKENEVKKSILDQFKGKTIQGMRALKRSMMNIEEKGGDYVTDIKKLPSYTKTIYDVMAAIGTDSESEAIRYIREDLPDAIVNADTTKALQEIKVLKSHITPKEISVPREQLPVGEGKLKVSKLEARMKGVLDSATEDQINELGLTTYQQMNKEETIAKAAEYVTTNKEDAIKVLKGDLEAPKGIPPEAIYIALLQESKSDSTLITKLASLQATALGQRLSLLTEIDKDSPVKLLNEVYKVREEEAKKKYKDLNKEKKSTIEDIKKEVKVADKYDIAAFFKSIECT